MWIMLNLDGIEFQFRISDYRKSTNVNWDVEWCRVDLKLQAQEWLNYQIVKDETLLAVEVEQIRDKIDDLLNGSLKKFETIECIEPDFAFYLYPQKDVEMAPFAVHTKAEKEVVDISMDLAVSFWDKEGRLTTNRLLLAFGREDMEKLSCYLRYVTGMISKEDAAINSLLAESCMYE
ncbi:MAG: hypothetical protein NC430_07460 [bacterium]|nr:hypothetical protein [bacterium]MCM1423701.1 hypothetical protein [bacterium]